MQQQLSAYLKQIEIWVKQCPHLFHSINCSSALLLLGHTMYAAQWLRPNVHIPLALPSAAAMLMRQAMSQISSAGAFASEPHVVGLSMREHKTQ